jgi:hypothetical protein
MRCKWRKIGKMGHGFRLLKLFEEVGKKKWAARDHATGNAFCKLQTGILTG